MKGSAKMTASPNQVPTASPFSDAGILTGFLEQAEFARTHRISPRTVARYRSQVDGLPSVSFGGRVYIPLREAGTWLSGRIRHPNKRRAN
jgi:hypothetical protein